MSGPSAWSGGGCSLRVSSACGAMVIGGEQVVLVVVVVIREDLLRFVGWKTGYWNQ